MAEIATAPITAVGNAGYLVAITTDEAQPGFQRVPASAIGEIAAKAETAVQPIDLGSAAFADTESFITPAALEAAMNELRAQIDVLTELVSGGSGGGGSTLPTVLPFILSE